MNTTQLKTFAAEARKSLLSGVKSKMNALGFKDNGTVDERDYPIQAPDGTLFQNEIYDVAFYGKWMRLRDEIARYGFRQVCEEGAYTWFNRLVAIQILSRNGLIDPVLEFESPDVRIPLLVKQAHEGIRPEMPAFDAMRLNAVVDDDNRITEQFAILIVAYCQAMPILYKCFGTLNDFTELLLPTNILAANGFLNLLNGSTFITEDDYKTTELIGWLYQFYISERKDEVFASFKSGHKAEAEDIPAATQIFTPNWIVKYMVQNTLGRIYLDNNPSSDLASNWEYLVDSPSERGHGGVLEVSSPESLTFADLSCGSGHILGEAFDMLFEIYKEEGFTRRQAIENIFRHNLIGIDIDTRAKQLATFALMLKACLQYPVAINCEVMPRVLDMTGLTPPNYEYLCDTLPHFFLGSTAKVQAETIAAINLMQQADNLGSIMKFDISPETRAAIAESMKRWEDECLEDFEGLFPAMRLILALTDKYATIVMNPPYMGNGNMNGELAKYAKDNYDDEKADLFAVFMRVAEDRLKPFGKYAMINMHSWMFLTSFLKLRTHVIEDLQIDSMLHLGPRTFDELGGEVVQNTAYVLTNAKPSHEGCYFRLVDYAPSAQKESLFREALRVIYTGGKQSRENLFFCVNQASFKKIPGNPIGYWVSKTLLDVFQNKKLGEICPVKKGADTADNNYFLRLWHEVSYNSLGIRQKNSIQFTENGFKWAPYNKGGHSRKWYGNNDVFVLWENNGYELEHSKGNLRSKHLYFQDSITWNALTTSAVSARYSDYGAIFDSAGSSMFPNEDKIFYLLAFMNTKCVDAILRILNPTLNYGAGTVSTLPSKLSLSDDIDTLTKECISISKADWDAHETSWDFQENELIRMQHRCINHAIRQVLMPIDPEDMDDELREIGRNPGLIKDAMQCYVNKWMRLHIHLHSNEEELNRQFIEIYGLKKELSPRVELDEVTILQQGEVTIPECEKNDPVPHLHSEYFNEDNIIKQFLSYAIGCYMGRYRLDRPGLHIAHPNPTAEELEPYQVPDFPYPELTQDLIDEHVLDVYDDYEEITDDIRITLDSTLAQKYESTKKHKFDSTPADFTIDDDGIIPLMPLDSGFPDCAAARVSEFVKLVFGEDNHAANMTYLEKTLGKDLESYFAKDFYADHKKRYQNRPIYWLFSSKKSAFQVLVYMHRMTPFTVERIRSKYLLPYIERLSNQINDMNASILKLTSAQARALQKMEKDLQECREYHDMLHPVANQNIAINLDDGVLVNYAKFGQVLAKLK